MTEKKKESGGKEKPKLTREKSNFAALKHKLSNAIGGSRSNISEPEMEEDDKVPRRKSFNPFALSRNRKVDKQSRKAGSRNPRKAGSQNPRHKGETEEDKGKLKKEVKGNPKDKEKETLRKIKQKEMLSKVENIYGDSSQELFEFQNPEVKLTDEFETSNFHEMMNYAALGNNVLDVTKSRVKAVIEKQKPVALDDAEP